MRLTVIILIILIIIYLTRKPIISEVKKVYGIMTNEKHLSTLHPKFRPLVERLLATAKAKGIDLKITASLRDFEEQQTLYEKGRKKPGYIVTNARPGSSKHNFALAIDVVPIVNGKAVWNNNKLWDEVGKIGEGLGLIWGARFKGLVDKPHFEYNIPLRTLQSLHASKNYTNGFIKI